MNSIHDSSATSVKLNTQQVTTSKFLSRLIVLAQTNDRFIALGLLLLCFVTRLIAVPASLWEWDDILFARAMHRYNLVGHSPHPPGFPVFVAMARVAFWIFNDEHRALATIALIFSSLIAPALFFFYRLVFQDRRIAIAGALLGSFAPSVWVHSGAGRSDEVAFTLGIIGLTLVIHGLKSQRSLIAGCAVFGLAMGVRVTLLPVMGAVIALVFLVRLWRREWRPVIAALAVGTFCVLVWYVPFIYKVTWRVYRSVMNTHSQFTVETDSIFSNTENAIASYRAQRFFVDIWGARWIMWAIYTLSALGLITLALKRRWQAIGWLALAFLPFMIFTWVLNTPLSAPLYSLPYIPLFTGLAACGLIMVPRIIFPTGRRVAWRNLGMFLTVGLTIGIAEWTYPIIKLLHREESPPVRASRYLQNNFDPEHDVLFFDGIFSPHVSFYLPEHRSFQIEEETAPEANLIGLLTGRPRIIGLTNDPIPGVDGQHFSWTSNKRGARRLRILSLGRYFDAHVSDITNTRGITYLTGWYPQEHDGSYGWRWMGRQGKIALLVSAESMILRFHGMTSVSEKLDRHPTVVFRLDGVEVDRQTLKSPEIDRTLVVKPKPDHVWSVLSIEIDQTIIPSRDSSIADDRELGIQCYGIEWSPAPDARLSIKSPDQYLDTGWWALEHNNGDYWRWTSGLATVNLPAIDGDARLDIKMLVPLRNDGKKREVTVEVAGDSIDKFEPPVGYFTKTYHVPHSLHLGKQAVLKLSAPPVSSADPRLLAIQVYYLGWRPSDKD